MNETPRRLGSISGIGREIIIWIHGVDHRVGQERSDIGNPGLSALRMWFKIGCVQLDVGTFPGLVKCSYRRGLQPKEAPLKCRVTEGRGRGNDKILVKECKLPVTKQVSSGDGRYTW